MATVRQKRVAKKVLESNGAVSISRAMREEGYPESTAKNPQQLTRSKGWNELMDEFLSDEELGRHHKELLQAKRVEHMTFPLGPIGEDDPIFSGAKPNKKDDGIKVERTTLTDKEIIGMLAEVGCKVKRIVHGETARHVYFWAHDNKSRKDGLDMAYKLKGLYQKDSPAGSIINNLIVVSDEQAARIAARLAGRSDGDGEEPSA